MESTVRERLTEFIRYKGLSVLEFEKRVGLSPGYVKNILRGIGKERLDAILDTFPDLNRDWLVYGEGEMVKGTTRNQPTHVYNASVGDGARGNMVVGAGTTFTQTGGMASDVTACLEIIKGMQEQILTLQRQLEESHCKVADLMMQALAKRE